MVETTKAGRLHLHVVATGEYVGVQALRSAATNAGFGRVTDIRALGGRKTPKGRLQREELVGRAAHYVSKYLADESKRRESLEAHVHVSKYLADESKRRESLEAHVRERLRPVRFSRGWGASLGSAKRDLVARWREERGQVASERHPDDEWLMVTRTNRGRFRVFRRGMEMDAGDVDLLVAGITPIADLLPRFQDPWRGRAACTTAPAPTP